MTPWKVLLAVFFSCSVNTGASRRSTRALYSSAGRVKRGMASMAKPIFLSSPEDAGLLFEILLAGVRFADDSGQFSVRDEELASLRKSRSLAVLCQDVLPKKLTEIRRLTSDLSQHAVPLDPEDFECTVLTMVYAAQQLGNATSGHQRDAWAESFVELYRTIKEDLEAK